MPRGEGVRIGSSAQKGGGRFTLEVGVDAVDPVLEDALEDRLCLVPDDEALRGEGGRSSVMAGEEAGDGEELTTKRGDDEGTGEGEHAERGGEGGRAGRGRGEVVVVANADARG